MPLNMPVIPKHGKQEPKTFIDSYFFGSYKIENIEEQSPAVFVGGQDELPESDPG